MSLSELKTRSYKSWDFSHSVLATYAGADENADKDKRDRRGVGIRRDDYAFEQYYFFSFGTERQAYNLADAGNFMWGLAGKRSGFSWFELKAGSNLNELRRFRGLDTDADQRAIEAGFDF